MWIEDLKDHIGEVVTVKGWVFNRRSSGKVRFIILRDGTGFSQVVLGKGIVSEEGFNLSHNIPYEAQIEVNGRIKEESRAIGGVEIEALDLKIVFLPHEEYPISTKSHGIDFLLSHRHLWLRSRRQFAIMRIRNEIIKAARDFFYERKFINIDSPILTPTSCEGTTTLFEVNYFDEKAYLSQSGQLYLEPAAAALGKVFCFGPAFRAEKSKTRRHLTEFWAIEPEVAFMDYKGAEELASSLIVYMIERVLENRQQELEILERDVDALKRIKLPFPVISYEEAIGLLNKKGNGTKYGEDFGGDEETLLSESFDRPLIIEKYPKSIKPFYMKEDTENPELVLNFDIIAPEGYGEIVGGSQREDDYDKLLENIKEHGIEMDTVDWYLDIRKYGSFVHSGFGLGLERTVAWISGIHHVREAIPYPRTLGRLYP